MNNPKEIALKIINDTDESSYFSDDIEPLALAYLELEESRFESYDKLADINMKLNEDIFNVKAQIKAITNYNEEILKKNYLLEQEIIKLKEENENLKRIISKELNENDEFGAEFVHVNILKNEIANLKTKLSLEQQDRDSEKRTYKTRIEAVVSYNEEILKKNYRLEQALKLAMYYVEGDATYEGLKFKIDEILNGDKELSDDKAT